MSVEVNMTDDIRKYEIKTVGPFTTRQIVCIVIAMLYSIPIGIFVPTSPENKILIICVVAIPVVAAGFIKIDGCKFEVLFIRLLYWKLLTPRKRKYKLNNSYRKRLNDMDKSREKKMIARMSESDRKSYIQRKKTNKGKSKNIQYSKKREYKVYT